MTALGGVDASAWSVACQLTPADIHAVQAALFRPAWGARHWGRHERWRRVLAGMALAGFVVLLLKQFSRSRLGADVVGWDAVMAAGVAGAFMGWLWSRHAHTVPPADSPLYLPFTLAIDAGGVHIAGQGFGQQVSWLQVTALRQAGGCLLIHTRLGETRFVPLRAFGRADAAQAFVARALALRDEAFNPLQHMPVQTLRYRLTRDDVRAALLGGQRGRRGWRGALAPVLMVGGVLATSALTADADDPTWWLGMGLAVGAAWLLARFVLFIHRRRAVARHPVSEGDVELQRWGDHLRVLTGGLAERTAYEQLGAVVATADHVFLFTHPDRALIVPRRAFAGQAEMAAFAAEVDRASKDSST